MNTRSERAPALGADAPANVFQRAFHSSPAVQSIVRMPDTVLVEVNAAFTRIFGYTREEVLGRNPVELNFWVRPELFLEYRARLQADGRVRDFEVEVRAKDGSRHTILLSSEIVEIDGVPHSMSAGVDITERKRTEARLREEEQRFRESEAKVRSLYDSLSTAVMVQSEGAFTMVNPAAVKLFDATRPEELLGRHPQDVSPPAQPDGEESGAASRRYIARALAEGTIRFEWTIRTLAGRDIPVEVTLTPLQLDGRPVLQAVVDDLRERKRAEIELQHALQRERELSHLKTDFVSLVSHEFRTPLEIIMSSVDNLDRYHERLQPAQREQLLRTIKKSVRRMAGMMEDVLMLGRVDAEGGEFKPAPVDIVAVCQRVRDDMESATARRCPIVLELAVPSGATAQADEAALRHILNNLLSNAVKYSAPGQVARLGLRREGSAAVFTIRDEGCGIPAADQGRLFQAFHRGSNVRQISGTGLGLLIVRRCVELHGGQIAFESEEGRGTTFTVRLPVFAEAP